MLRPSVLSRIPASVAATRIVSCVEPSRHLLDFLYGHHVTRQLVQGFILIRLPITSHRKADRVVQFLYEYTLKSGFVVIIPAPECFFSEVLGELVGGHIFRLFRIRDVGLHLGNEVVGCIRLERIIEKPAICF